MDEIVYLVIGFICIVQGARAYQCEEQTKIFSKQLTDVKKYNQFCGTLFIGYGIVAMITLFGVKAMGGMNLISTLMLVVEAFILMKIYNNGVKKYLKK